MIDAIRSRGGWFWLAALLAAPAILAEVTVSVDRDRVELNESFTLEISVDSNTTSDPEISALDEDFFIGQRRDMSNTTIVNGQIRRSRTWTYSLMAKRAGQLTIPPVSVDGKSSEPMTITVTEPTYEPPGEADVFITTEVDATETYVQAQVLYRIKVYRAVSTRQPTLREPVFSGAEVLIELGGDERNYDAILGGKAYQVNERVYAVFPQESGTIEISPARFEARVLKGGRITGRKVFTSESHAIDVKPIPPPPAEFADAQWLPARDVRLSQDWSSEPDEITAGQPITRNVTVTVLGQLETQIPAIEPPSIAGINVYPDQPELSRQTEAEGIRGVRRDRYAIIGVEAGTVSLPELALPWFDLGSNEWKVARLPANEIRVLPTDDVFDPPPPAVDDTPVQVDDGVVVQSPFWKRIAQFLAAAWALTLFAWWWASRPSRDEVEPEAPPLHRQQSRLLKDARKAARDRDRTGVRHAMLAWAELQWPERPPRSIGELAMRVSTPLSDELDVLSRSSYGAGGDSWDGEALATAIRSFSVLSESDKAPASDTLPPLLPR